MILEQCLNTIIKAEDGKVLRKISTGSIVGNTVHLGYNYYEVGMPLSEPYLEKPEDYEEINIPENYEYDSAVIDLSKRLKIIKRLLDEEKKVISSRKLSAEDMLNIKSLYPRWNEDINVGDEVLKGFKFLYENKLYTVLQDHVILEYYYPNSNTSTLYKEITLDYEEEEKIINTTTVASGTLEDPIAYGGDMILEKDKYYTDEGLTYICIEDSLSPVNLVLHDLIGIYVDLI